MEQLCPRIWLKKEEMYYPEKIYEFVLLGDSCKFVGIKINGKEINFKEIELDNFLNCHSKESIPIYENDILHHHIDLNIVASQNINHKDPYNLLVAKVNFGKIQKKTQIDRASIVGNKRIVFKDLKQLIKNEIRWIKEFNAKVLYSICIDKYIFQIQEDEFGRLFLEGKYLLPKAMIPTKDHEEAKKMANDAILQGFSMLFGMDLSKQFKSMFFGNDLNKKNIL